MRTLARRALERLLVRFDYRLTDTLADPAGLGQACARLRAGGFEPRTVIDVGVGPGTPWLYAAFPQARFELFEANEAFRPQIEVATRGLDAQAHYCALGEAPGTLTIEINRDTPTSSTMARYESRYLDRGAGPVGDRPCWRAMCRSEPSTNSARLPAPCC